ncbi:hypothetical protein, partial [Kineococcus glutinatus]|uniref:hypothetical protein n=1 Tax=Kineococcus glutinatus TaxID=1070872 RepID=UPI0031EE330E
MPPREPRRVPPGLEEFAEQRGAALLAVARTLLPDPAAAVDVVAGVLARVAPRWERLCAEEDPRLAVDRLLVAACTSRRRPFRAGPFRRPPAGSGDDGEDRGEDHGGGGSAGGTDDGAEPDADGPPQHDEPYDEQHDELLAALRRLPTRQRAVLVLRHVEGLADEDV